MRRLMHMFIFSKIPFYTVTKEGCQGDHTDLSLSNERFDVHVAYLAQSIVEFRLKNLSYPPLLNKKWSAAVYFEILT